jgi:hypothetical protein
MNPLKTLPAGRVLPLLVPALAMLVLLVPTYLEVALRLWQQEGLSYAPLLALLALGLLLYRGRELGFVPDNRFPVLGTALLLSEVVNFSQLHRPEHVKVS